MPTERKSLPDPTLRARFAVDQVFQGGEGWSGAVRERSSGAVRLVKVLTPGAQLDEASLAGSLGHPQIPEVLEVGRTRAGEPFVVREFVRGHTLDGRTPLPVEQCVALAEELLEILVFVHLRGVLHLDIKPANVLERDAADAQASGRYVLLDFGLGHRGHRGLAAGGTPFFQSPEVALGLPPDPRSDLFSVGATVFALLHSERPNLAAFLRRFPREDFLAASGCDPRELPAPFDTWLPRMCARSMDERFADAQDALEALAKGRGTGRPSPAALAPDPIAFYSDALDERVDALEPGVTLEVRGGEASDRRALAMHAAARLGDVESVEIDERACRLLRTGGGGRIEPFDVPELTVGTLAGHLRAAVQLDEVTSRAAAERLRADGVDRPAAVTRRLRALVEARAIVPDGPRWIWPAALAGRIDGTLDLASDRDSDRDVDESTLRELAAAGQIELAVERYRRAVALAPERDRSLRRGLVRGLIHAGESARAVPLAHDLPLLRVLALIELARVRDARALLAATDPALDPEQHARLDATIRHEEGESDSALALLDSAGTDAHDEAVRGWILAGIGRRDEARQILRSVLERLPADERPFVRAATLSNLGELERDDSVEAARACHEEALELFRRLGNVRHTAIASSNLGVACKDLGRHAQALEHLRRARSLFEHVTDATGAFLAEANLGIVSLESGDASAALPRLRRARDGLEALDSRRMHPLLDVLRARACAMLGEGDRARELLRSVEGVEDARVAGERARVLTLLATRDERGEHDEHDEHDRQHEHRPMGRDEDSEMFEPTVTDRPVLETGISKAAFRTFLAVNKRLATGRDLKSAMRYLLDAAVTLAGARDGYLLVADDDDRLRLELATTEDAVARSFSRSLANRAIQQQRVVDAEDALADRDLMEMPSVRGLGVRSALCVPFRASGGTQGALYVEHSGRRGAFGDAEKELLEILADQAAIAVDRLGYEDELAAQLKDSRRQLAVADRKLKRRARVRMIGRSPGMQELERQIDKFAATDLPVLILGETGSGKELVAQRLHDASPVADGPFLAENCSAIPAELIESELFGYVEGAFTGADTDRAGLLELASGGTLFLDEVGDMPLVMQLKLLRALQEGEIRRVGGRDTIPVRVRIVSATHRDLQENIGTGEFREDLYYRIAAGVIRVPPLRERGDDVIEIAQSVLDRLNAEHSRDVRIGDAARARLLGYDWPGNVRELEHVIAREFLLSEGDELDLQGLRSTAPGTGDHARTAAGDAADAGVPAASAWPVLTLQEVEARTIEAALRQTGGDKSKAARVLGISRTALYDKLKRIGARNDDAGGPA